MNIGTSSMQTSQPLMLSKKQLEKDAPKRAVFSDAEMSLKKKSNQKRRKWIFLLLQQ
jgi:hypothetical protein